MPRLVLYFQLHEPFLLHPEVERFLWEEKNQERFERDASRCFLPGAQLLTELVRGYAGFKVCVSMTGTFLKLAEQYGPPVVWALHELLDAGSERGQVEFLEETFFHSLAGLFEDPQKREFKDQVSMHRGKMRDLFGYRPAVLRNTELIYSAEIANTVADMGYRLMLTESREDMFVSQTNEPVRVGEVYRACGRRGRPRDLLVLLRDRELSERLCSRGRDGAKAAVEFARKAVEARASAAEAEAEEGDVVLVGCNFSELVGSAGSEEQTGRFWRHLPEALAQQEGLAMATPTEVADAYRGQEPATLEVRGPNGWSALGRDTFGWIECEAQSTLLRDIELLEEDARGAGGTLFQKWRVLTSCDHLYYLREKRERNLSLVNYENPYGSLTQATFVVTRVVDNFRFSAKTFNIRKRTSVTPVIMVTPETGRLPTEGLGQFAQYVSGKSGGLGEVVSALCRGFADRKIAAHLVTLNLRRRFQEESHLSDEEWIQSRHKLNPENVHLVSSSIFEDYRSAYDGNPVETAAEFQRQIVNTYIKEIRSKYDGRAILHSHDWMAGGTIGAYAKLRGIPVLHSVHNTHTANVPLESLHGINVGRLWPYLYLTWDQGRQCVDAQATAIKSATKISYVGKRFLREVINDYFLDRPIVPWSVREETKAKYRAGAAMVIYNGISPDVYPENQRVGEGMDEPGLAVAYRVEDDVLEAKRRNRVKFQRKMGLVEDPEAILLYWPSRLDPLQKGIDLLEEVAGKFVATHEDVQIAVVGNPVGSDRTHAEVLGRIAWASKGRVAYQRFSEDLSVLGYAAATDVFGASLYEPFGQIDVVGNLYGATATNRDTGGYSDKIIPLSLQVWGAPQDLGNGVLFRTYDAKGLWWGLHQAVENHRFFRSDPREYERQMKRIMREARRNWSLENMVAGYITAYEELNDGRPLV